MPQAPLTGRQLQHLVIILWDRVADRVHEFRAQVWLRREADDFIRLVQAAHPTWVLVGVHPALLFLLTLVGVVICSSDRRSFCSLDVGRPV